MLFTEGSFGVSLLDLLDFKTHIMEGRLQGDLVFWNNVAGRVGVCLLGNSNSYQNFKFWLLD